MKSICLGSPANGDIIMSDRYTAVIAVLTVIAVSIAWLRIHKRIFVSRNTGLDDGTMLAASVNIAWMREMLVRP